MNWKGNWRSARGLRNEQLIDFLWVMMEFGISRLVVAIPFCFLCFYGDDWNESG